MKRATVVIMVVVALLLVLAVPALAQSTTSLDISTANITPNLFLGANIMISALLNVMMLVAGLGFGLMILLRIVKAIGSGLSR